MDGRAAALGTLAPLIDTHCHLTFPQFEGRTAEILADARRVGVVGAITIATTTADSTRTRALAQQHANLWCSAGVHPLYSDEPADWEVMRAAGLDPKCVAWGELGLDCHYTDPPQEVQRATLETQLAHITRWRREDPRLDKPVIVHCRDAFDDLIPILRASSLAADRFVFHCFTAGEREARMVLDFGACLSFTGVVTFNNAVATRAAAKIVPIARVMVETDSPFLTPEPHRTTRPNEPKFVVHVAHALAELWQKPREEVEQALDANARAFFGIDPQ